MKNVQFISSTLICILLLLLVIDNNLIRINILAQEPEKPNPSTEAVQSWKNFNNLFDINLNCLSPCWWGYHLEEDTGKDLFLFLEKEIGRPYFTYDGNMKEGFSVYSLADSISPYSLFVDLEKEKLDELHLIARHIYDHQITNDYVEAYSLAQLVEAYGVPSHVFIDYQVFDRITLVYEEHHLIVNYSWRNNLALNMPYNLVCTDNEWLLQFEMYVYSSQESFSENEDKAMISMEREQNQLALENATSLNINEFTKILSDDPDICIEVEEYR